MSDLGQRFRIALLTARRAGWHRSLARLRRIIFLRWLNPRFAAHLYPPRVVHPPHIDDVADLIPIAFRVASPAWNGEITLLNAAPFAMRPPIDWNTNPIGHTLWSFRLHEFDWAWQLVQRAAQSDDASVSALSEIICDHIEHVPFARGIAGEPYTISRRLVVFSVAWHVLQLPPLFDGVSRTGEGWGGDLASHIDQCARWLRNHIEHDLDNNHVVANAKALAFAGMLMGQIDYAQRGFDLLWKQLRVQIRDDGMHFENSTAYHWHVLCDALDCARLARRFEIPVPDDIPPRLQKMMDVLNALRRPDGSLPLLNDSVDERFENVGDVIASEAKQSPYFTLVDASKRNLTCFGESGYAILKCGSTTVLFDAGALGPAFCPGHGHADALSFELWARNQLLITDPGVYQYQAGEWRDYFRGTSSHSTIVIDGLDQSELSDSFRVGAMAEARFTHVDVDHNRVEGMHTGYRRLRQPLTHHRAVTLANENELVIDDRLEGIGEHDIDVCFHLAPGARVEAGEQSALVFFDDDVQLHFQFEGAQSLNVAASDGWYSPTWYTKLLAPVLHYRGRCAVPLVIKTKITW